jgi:hypothetical protein
MLSTLDIVLIIFIIVCIILIGYNIINKKNKTDEKDEKDGIDILLNNVDKYFNIKKTNTNDKFTNEVIFNTLEDVTKNMVLFIKYMCPSIDIKKIDELLKENGLNKTVEIIFDEHKNMDSFKYLDVFNIIPLSTLNVYNLFTYQNDDEIKKYLRLYLIVFYSYIKLLVNKKLQTNANFKTERGGIDKVEYEFNSDYLTNDLINIYIRTALNNNTPIGQAETVGDKHMNNCYNTNKLCKYSGSMNDLLKTLKPIVKDNINDINKLFNLLFVKYLFDLNNVNNDGTTITKPIILSNTVINEISQLKTTLHKKKIIVPDSSNF